MGESWVAGAARRDLGRDEEMPLPTAAAQTPAPEGQGSSREWGLLEGICNSRLYFSSHSII